MQSFDAAKYYVDLIVLAPLVILVFAGVKGEDGRQALFLAFGLALTFFVAPRLIVFYAVFWTVVLAFQELLFRTRESRFDAVVLVLAILLTLLPMVAWKWRVDDFQLQFQMSLQTILFSLSPTLAYIDSHRETLMPVGLSFATFRALDLLLQTYLGIVDRVGYLRIYSYGFNPFILPFGPIATVQEISADKDLNRYNLLYGIWRISTGFLKIFVLAQTLKPWGAVFYSLDRPIYQTFLGLYVYAFYFYLNFAGYSDLAIGTARLFGVHLPENFRWPLVRENPRQFWNNWHATLSRFAQQYIFTFAGGMRQYRRNLALLATMMVIAWWHDLNLSWTLFGLYHGAGLIAHNIWSQNRPAILERHQGSIVYSLTCRFLLLSYVSLGFPIISMIPAELPHFYLRLLGIEP
jgi:alginate O-acetyltransferase complex protein AlgI